MMDQLAALEEQLYNQTGDAREAIELTEAFELGRSDHQFFAWFFLNRRLHDGQLDFAQNAEATVNVLACSNRWGKTTLVPHLHYHACLYKTGAEERYLLDDFSVDPIAFVQTKYETAHTGPDWERTQLSWTEALKMFGESETLRAFVSNTPRSLPPHIDFVNGSRWKFRTLGDKAETIDGTSLYLLSVDEAGWLENLDEMMSNVLRVRIADVRGRIVLLGTFQPGISRDFRQYAVKAASEMGASIGFDYRGEVDSELRVGGIDPSIKRLLLEEARKNPLLAGELEARGLKDDGAAGDDGSESAS